MFSMIGLRARAEPNETALQVAENAATYTISQAISENGGYEWTDYMQSPYNDASLQLGSAGYGTLYLELYNQTGNPLYLNYAEGAAQWIISQAVNDSGGYKWPHHDDDNPSPGWWLSPVVSCVGDFLLLMYETTGNTTYLDYATGAAKWLMAMAYWGEPGCFIPYNPPDPYGTQAAFGIDPATEAYTVTFLLHLYEETGNTAYLPYVEGTAEWLISGPDKIQTPNGYEWRFNRPYYSDYPPDGEGRIALFFYEVYQALDNSTYLQYAQGTMNWLLNQATVNGDTAKWYDAGTGSYRTLPFSGCTMGGVWGFWGVPEPNELLISVYDISGNATYREYAEKLANWIISPDIAVSEGGGYKFPDSEGGSLYSAYENARIYDFLSWLYNVTGETSYRDYANGALQWIISNATEENGGYKWATLDYSPYYASWFDGGAAGIGYYLADLNEMTIVSNPQPTPPEPLSIKLGGDFIYPSTESTVVQIAALVEDTNKKQPVSGADIEIKIYDPQNSLWVSGQMTEMPNQQGIYTWQSTQTVQEIFQQGGIGTYIVYANATKENYSQASDMFEFNIDQVQGNSLPILTIIIVAIVALLIIAVAALALSKKRRTH
jgi:rhamnogalacturonyl hydrolase YesR